MSTKVSVIDTFYFRVYGCFFCALNENRRGEAGWRIERMMEKEFLYRYMVRNHARDYLTGREDAKVSFESAVDGMWGRGVYLLWRAIFSIFYWGLMALAAITMHDIYAGSGFIAAAAIVAVHRIFFVIRRTREATELASYRIAKLLEIAQSGPYYRTDQDIG